MILLIVPKRSLQRRRGAIELRLCFVLMLAGFILCITIPGLPLGIPMLVIGWYLVLQGIF